MRTKVTRLIAGLVVAGLVATMASSTLLQMGVGMWLVLVVAAGLLITPVVLVVRGSDEPPQR